MMSTQEDSQISFSCPAITAKSYLAKGPSGWIETFDRARCDAELAKFIAPAGVDELLEVFLLRRETAEKKEPIDWFLIIGFLGRTIGVSPRNVPADVGVAFWGRAILAAREARAN